MTTDTEIQSKRNVEAKPRPSPISHWLLHLEGRSLPQFNQFVIWTLLATALILAFWPFQLHAGARSNLVSLLSWLPTFLLVHPLTWWIVRVLLIAGVALWAMQRCLPWSCWLATLAFTALWSLHVETTHNTAHIFNMPNMLLIIQCLWISADAPLIRSRLQSGTYWTLPLVPRWVTLASIAYIGIFHSAAGLSKLAFSGTGWANGTSLQLWTYLWGRPWSPTTQLLLSHRAVAQGLQIFTLIIETAAILAVFPRFRPWIGWALLAFYAGVLATFDYGFEFNALLTAVYFLPLEQIMNARSKLPRSHGDPS